jgi:hypothetical protein
MKLQYKRSEDTIYAYDDNYNFLGSWPCHHDFFPRHWVQWSAARNITRWILSTLLGRLT